PDFLPLHVVRQLAQAATLVRVQRGKLVATPVLSQVSENIAGSGIVQSRVSFPARWRPRSSDRCSGSDYSSTAKNFRAAGSASIIFIAKRSCSIDCSPLTSR